MGAWTFSQAGTLLGCAWPFRSDVTVPRDEGPNEARDKGTAIHNACAVLINRKLGFEVLDPAENLTYANARAWIVSNYRDTWVAEPAYAWDRAKDKARLLGVDIGREYEKHGKQSHEEAGTCDVVSVEGDTVYVYEFGTGYEIDHKVDQLRIQCAVAAMAHGCSRAVGQLVKFRDEGAYPLPQLVLDAFDLAAIAGEFDERLRSVEGSEPTPGEHCRRCNAVVICPEGQRATEALVPVSALTKRHEFSLTVQDGEHAAWMLERLKLVKAAAKRFEDAIKSALPPEGWELADGSVLREGRRAVERFSRARAVAMLLELGATPAQIAELDVPSEESAGLKVFKARKGKAA